jgi:hypothetical protein
MDAGHAARRGGGLPRARRREGGPAAPQRPARRRPRASWKFLTNHALVLMCLVEAPTARTKDLARWIGITDRAAQRIVAELEAAGYLSSVKVGRGKRYRVRATAPMRHPLQRHRKVGALLGLTPRLPAREAR